MGATIWDPEWNIHFKTRWNTLLVNGNYTNSLSLRNKENFPVRLCLNVTNSKSWFVYFFRRDVLNKPQNRANYSRFTVILTLESHVFVGKITNLQRVCNRIKDQIPMPCRGSNLTSKERAQRKLRWEPKYTSSL